MISWAALAHLCHPIYMSSAFLLYMHMRVEGQTIV